MSYPQPSPRNTTTSLVNIFYNLKISYIVNISSFSVSHLVLYMYVPCSIVQVLWIPYSTAFIDGLQVPWGLKDQLNNHNMYKSQKYVSPVNVYTRKSIECSNAKTFPTWN